MVNYLVMDRLSLKVQLREVLGKKVKKLRREGIMPANVFGKKTDSTAISIKLSDFIKTYKAAGETGLIDLKIEGSSVRPVLIRDVQVNPVRGTPVHVDFYQVNLSEKVTVPVPIILEGEETELVKMGEAVVIQPMGEVEVEALPTDLPDKIVVDITSLRAIDDAVIVSQLKIPEGVVVLAEPDAVVVKLDTAVTEEMKQLMEEQAAEQAAVTEAQAEEAGEAPVEGAEGETPAEGEAAEEEKPVEGSEEKKEEPKE